MSLVDEHLGEPGAKHGPDNLRRRMGGRTVVAFLSRSSEPAVAGVVYKSMFEKN